MLDTALWGAGHESFNPTLDTTQLLRLLVLDLLEIERMVSIPHWIRLSYSVLASVVSDPREPGFNPTLDTTQLLRCARLCLKAV